MEAPDWNVGNISFALVSLNHVGVWIRSEFLWRQLLLHGCV